MEFERRSFEVGFKVETRDDAPPKLTGRAVVYGQRSLKLGDFYEVFEPGAFQESLLSDDARMVWNHNDMYVLGRRSAGTLRLREDDQGLSFENDPPDTTWARDLMTSTRRGDIREMSFRFRVPPGGHRWEVKDGENLRTVMRAKLLEISPVTFPAYPQTDVAVRSFRLWQEETEEAWKRENEHLRRLTEIASAT